MRNSGDNGIELETRNLLTREYSTSPENNTGEQDGGEKKVSKIRALFNEYGRIAILGYMVIGTIDLALSIAFVYFSGEGFIGKAVEFLSNYFPSLSPKIPEEGAEIPSSGSSFFSPEMTVVLVVGYAIHKLLLPLRLAIIAAISPAMSRKAYKMGWTWLYNKKP
ncbi:hypothetical protein BB558_003418 [Smittium angustum]|uniref:DUF1279 domain-containing protein n=1 Tax=Smittium angustum TaxID=133377 RepID=A0A2U1J629_SMIAN|nr:hypothetical protein BB558_003418 [Smittium angustum]